MSYTDQKKMSGSKIGAIVIVALLHIALGYAFLTGLAYQYIKKTTEKLNTFDVAPPPPPPPDVPPPPPPPDQKVTPPPVVAPPPIVNIPMPAPPIATVSQPPPPRPVTPPSPPAPPAPPAPVQSKAAGLKGNPAQFFGPDAYPPAAQRAEAQGRVVAKLTVGTDGRVSDCQVMTSSNNSDLDSATCRIAKARVRFTPAQDASGTPITSSYTLPVRWQLPKD